MEVQLVRQQPRASVRGLLVLLILVGVIGMHSLAAVNVPAPAATSADAMVMPDAQPAAAAVNLGTASSHRGGHGQHATMHECLAVLATAVLAVILMLLAVGATVTPPTRHRLRAARTSLGRAPPWTTPTLAELSVLRV